MISRRWSPRSIRPFERVHLDLFEQDRAYNAHKYAMAMKEEHSGVIFIVTLATKTQVYEEVVNFEARIRRQF